MIDRLRRWANALKRDVIVLWLAARDPRVPLGAKLLAAFFAAYAFSPIDLIPDFIPVLGLLDDLLIVPAGVWITLRLIPPAVLIALRADATNRPRPQKSGIAAVVIVVIWLTGAVIAARGLLA